MKNIYKKEIIKMVDHREAARLRPGMYLGNTGWHGFHNLLRGTLSSSFFIFNVQQVELKMRDPYNFSLKLFSPSKEIHSEWFTKPNFQDKNGFIWMPFFFNFDLFVLNALSEKLKFTSYNADQSILKQFTFSKGIKESENFNNPGIPNAWELNFKLDKEVWGNLIEIIPNKIIQTLKTHAQLSKTIFKFSYSGINESIQYDWHSKAGLINYFNETYASENRFKIPTTVIDKISENLQFEFVFNFSQHSTKENQLTSFCNHIKLLGGSIEKGIYNGIRKAIRFYIKKHSINIEVSFSKKRITHILTGCAQIVYPNAKFARATMTYLDEPTLEKPISEMVKTHLVKTLESDHEQALELVKYFS